ncbi:hypothetical protein AUJ13_00740 [Candidatus Micrarchaeota archaeon CG1_02_49_24]|nr:MAG: hypothetical protein AUJ13_00740 [Candidatus Micrarchaeota archaeon CG1_02_49_24]
MLLLRDIYYINKNLDVGMGDLLIDSESGRIERIGKDLPAAGCEKIEGKGMLAMSAFFNMHTHSPMTLFRNLAENMRLHEWLSKVIWPLEKKTSETDIYYSSMVAFIEMIKSGTGCFNDMYFHMEAIARASKQIGIRACLGYGMIDLNDEGKRDREMRECERVLKKYSNGKHSELITANVAPHSIYTCSKKLLTEAKKLAGSYGTTYNIHCSETRKEVFDCLGVNKCRPVEYLEKLKVLDEKTILAHSVWVAKQEVAIMGKRKCSVSHNPVSNMKLASGGEIPLPEMFDAGVNVCLGTDGAASNNSLNMFETMKTAALIQNQFRWDPTIISPKQMLKCATVNGAKALGINSGAIAEGKLADITVLSLDANLQPANEKTLVNAIVYSANPSNVKHVIINGKLVLKDGKITTVDEQKIIDEFNKRAERLASASDCGAEI